MGRKKSAYVKCKYSHCKHENREVLREESVSSGNLYYHKDCYQEKETMKKCIDIYVKYFEDKPIFTQLRNVIDDIVYKKGYDAEYLLFALKYGALHRKPIKHPPGIYYLIKDDSIAKEWNKEKLMANKEHVVVNNKDTEYVHVPKKQVGFADIIGG